MSDPAPDPDPWPLPRLIRGMLIFFPIFGICCCRQAQTRLARFAGGARKARNKEKSVRSETWWRQEGARIMYFYKSFPTYSYKSGYKN